MKLQLIEPLRELFKDEVRELGAELGLPDEIVWPPAVPRPGPGVRILGEVTPARLRILRAADAIVREEMRERRARRRDLAVPSRSSCRCALGRGAWATSAPTKTRSPLRAVTSEDGMTADWARLPTICSTASPRASSTRSTGEPRRPRHHVQAPRHHRVGVIAGLRARRSEATSVKRDAERQQRPRVPPPGEHTGDGEQQHHRDGDAPVVADHESYQNRPKPSDPSLQLSPR